MTDAMAYDAPEPARCDSKAFERNGCM